MLLGLDRTRAFGMKLLALLFTVCVCGCASDRLARVSERHIENRDQLVQLLGRPDRIRRVESGARWVYHSHGFNLLLLRSWHRTLTCLVHKSGSVTDLRLTGTSAQYHLSSPIVLPEDLNWLSNAYVIVVEPPPLNTHRVADSEYVVIDDLAQFYNLGHNRSRSRGQAIYRTSSTQLVLDADSREIQIDGVQRELRSRVLLARRRLWVAKDDVLNIIDPGLREKHPYKPLRISTWGRL